MSKKRTPYSGPRTRTAGGFVLQSPLQIWTRATPTSSWVGGPILPTIQTGFYDSMTDIVVPNFKELVAEGKVFFNPMQSSKWRIRSVGGQGYEQINKVTPYNSVKVEGDWLGHTIAQGGTPDPFYRPGLFDTDLTRMMTEVSTEVLANRGLAPIGLAEDIAEYKATIGLVHDFNRQVNLHIPTRILKSPRDVANAWLAFRYGVKPLAMDMWELFKAAAAPRRPPRRTTRAFLKDTRESSSIKLYQGSGSIGTNVQTVLKQTVNIRGMSLDEVLFERATELGLTFKSLATLPWELTYASFVADWFFSFGNYIKTYVPAVGFSQLGSCLTIEDERLLTFSVLNNFDGTAFSLVRPCSGTVTAEKIVKRRQGLLSPEVVVNHDFGLGLHTDRLKDALALTGTKILSVFKR